MTHVAATTLTAATLNAQIRDNFNAAYPVGSIHYFMQNGTSTETTINGFALEMNAASVLRATYPNLNTLLSGLGYPFGTVDGTHMTMPDGRGRSLFHASSGGHGDVNAIGDNDTLPVANRTPQHNTSAGTLAGVLPNHVHVDTLGFAIDTNQEFLQEPDNPHATSGTVAGGGLGIWLQAPIRALTKSGSVGNPTSNPSISLSGVGGPGGGRPNDLTPWLVAGVYAVKY